jgi:nucleoside-diphosphate-sugar epimerase
MKVFVAGASGALGIPITRKLIERRHEVIGLTRSQDGARQLAELGARPVIADALDREALLRATQGLEADVLVHELTALTKPPFRISGMDATNRLRTEGSRTLLEVANAIGARRFVTQSIVFGYGFRDHGHTVLTENAAFGQPEGKPTDAILAALFEAEARAADAGEGIALRYGLLYGGDAPNIVPLLRRRMVPVVQGGLLGWIHHDDAATATVAAVERGSPGAYNIVDDEPATFEQVFTAMAAAIGAPRPFKVPRWLMELVAPYVVAFGIDTQIRASKAKAMKELGWEPRYGTYREGVAAMARDLREGTSGVRQRRLDRASR